MKQMQYAWKIMVDNELFC